MTENNTESRDALDELRTWIRKNLSFGSLKPELAVEDGVVVAIYVQRGDEKIRLQKGDFGKVTTSKKNDSHF